MRSEQPLSLIHICGIYGGFFTATEASAVAVAYAMIVGFFVYRTLTLKKLFETFKEAAIMVTVIMLVLSTAQLFAYILTYANVPTTVCLLYTSRCV